MNLFSWAADIFRDDNPLFLTRDTSKISPISTVSTKPAEIGTVDTMTRTVYEPLTAINSKTPSEIEIFKTTPINTGVVLKAPDDYYLSTQAQASGSQGNIWDIIKARAQDVIVTGTNVLLQKVADYGKANETIFVPSAQVAVSGYNPTYSRIMNYINQTEVKSEADTKTPNVISGGAFKLDSNVMITLSAIVIVVLLLFLRRR